MNTRKKYIFCHIFVSVFKILLLLTIGKGLIYLAASLCTMLPALLPTANKCSYTLFRRFFT